MERLGNRGFQTTRWSVIRRAGEHGTPEARDALSTLCRLYQYPCYAFVRNKVGDADKAADLTQGFFARLLEKNDLAAVDSRRARFRTWLLASLSHYLANQRDYETRQKRNPGEPLVPIDAVEAESRFHQEPLRDLSPEKLLERRWALTVIERALAALRAEEEGAANGQLFHALKGSLLGDGDERSYQQIARELGRTANAVKQAAYRLRRRCRDLIRAEVADTLELADEEEIDDEIRQLLVALA